jgi:superfamily I DNA and/or RNA helicase
MSMLHKSVYCYSLQILALPSDLFYGKQLTCSAKFSFEKRLKDVSPLKFVGVSGRECRDEGSPSYYNILEAVEVTEQVLVVIASYNLL